MPNTTQTRITPLSWATLALLALIWGGSFLSIRIALEEVGVLTVVAFRVGLAAAVLWAFVLLRGLPVPRGWGWVLSCLFLGLFNNILPFCLIVWGQTHIPSGLAGILNASNVIFSVGLAALIFRDERLTARKTVGIALGVAGVAMTIGPDVLTHLDLSSLGQLAILGASLSYAISSIYSRHRLRAVRPEVVAAGMLSVSSLVMIPAALWVEGTPSFAYALQTWGALGYISVISTAFAYILFYRVLLTAGAGNVSLVTLMIAPVAVVLGAAVYAEALPHGAYLGLGLLVLGMLVIDGRISAIFRVKPA
jgi:drug/metabolite transporter (DMT)-like permease